MKKILLSAIVIGFSALHANAQCSPGNINVDFQPTINTSLPAAPVAQLYNTTILFKAPLTLSVSISDIPGGVIPAQLSGILALAGISSIDATVNSMVVGGVSGQPNGLTYNIGGGTAGTFNAGEQGCIGLTGTPTQTGAFTVTLDVQYNLSFDASSFGFGVIAFPQAVPSPQARTYNISVPTSIEELDANAFSLTNNAPNPFDYKTQILFSTPKQSKVELTVFNMLGEMVFTHMYDSKAGKNAIEFVADKLNSGLYIYNLRTGGEVRTGKFTVAK